MTPVVVDGRHVGWEGQRSEAYDRVVARARPLESYDPELVARFRDLLDGGSTWMPGHGSIRVHGGHFVTLGHRDLVTWLTDAEADEIYVDCGSVGRHPGAMYPGLVFFIEHWSQRGQT